MAILFCQDRCAGAGGGAVWEQRLMKPAKLSKVQPEAMLQGSLEIFCPGGCKCPKRACTGNEARQPHNRQPQKNPELHLCQGRGRMQPDPDCFRDDRPHPCACGSKAYRATCPAAGQSQTLTCFLHEVLIHGHNPLHGGSISVERGQIRQLFSQEGSLQSTALQISKFQAQLQRYSHVFLASIALS